MAIDYRYQVQHSPHHASHQQVIDHLHD